MGNKNRKKFLHLLFLSLILSVIAVPAIPATVFADDPGVRQAAPLNPAFVEYLQRQQDALKAQQTAMQNGTVITQERNYGYIPPSVDLRHIERLRALASKTMLNAGAGALPSAFNWTTPTNYVTSVKNQNPCGTCWAFGNTAVMESKVWIDGRATNPDYSEQALTCCTDPSWTALAADRCDEGGDDYEAQDTFIKKGVILETCQPYNTGTINTQACLTCTPTYQTTNFVWVASTDTTTEARDAIKTAIQTYGPVTVSYYHNGSYVYSGAKYYYTGAATQNHLVSLVGWDDNLPHPLDSGSGAWLMKNSWGTAYGNSGYYWLCYGKSNATDFGSLRTVKAYDSAEKLYYLDEAGWIGNTGWTDTSAWMANKFTASAAGSLTHVDFYTGGVSTQYDVRVYKSGNINSLGTSAATQTGTCGDAPGYYSIMLSTPVALSNGQDFIVVAKMTTPGYNLPIPIETIGTGHNPTIQAGRSYEKHLEGDPWTDAGATWGENVCLRARVTSGSSTQYTLTTSVASGSGSISLNPAGGTYASGTTVTLTANPSSGYQFSSWSGTNNNSINPTTVTMDSNKSVTVYFTQILPTPPTVTNASGATSVTATTATLNGNLTNKGTASSVNLSFEYGLTTAYGSPIAGVPPTASTTPQAFSAGISGLTVSTLYHYRALAVGDGSANGGDQIFITLTALPSVTTTAATNIVANSATLNGNLSNDGGEACQYRFCWGTSPGVYPDNTVWSTGSGRTGTTFSANVTSLTPGTKYYFIAQCKNSAGTGTGIEKYFTTKPSVLTGFTATAQSSSQVNLSWTKGTGAQKTMIRRSNSAFPTEPSAGTQVYFDTGTSYADASLTPKTTCYYSAWSWIEGSDIWSESYATTQITLPSITVTSPVGGESWASGSSRIVTWTSTGAIINVNIQLSRDGGDTYTTIIPDTPNFGSQAWTVTTPSTSQARIKITAVLDPTVSDISDANFDITNITVASPNGGEIWGVGHSENITWTSSGASGDVKILLSRNGGTTYPTVIVASTPNVGTHAWKVTAPVTTTARIRIVSVSDPTLSDISNDNFAIATPPTAPTLVLPTSGATTENLTPMLDWNNAAGAIAYGVQVSTASTFATGTLRVDVSSGLPTSDYTVIGSDNLTWNTTYNWRANAANAAGNSAWSASRTFKTPWGAPRPTGLTATENSSTRIYLAWVDISSDETGFKIERSKSADGPFAQIATVGPGVAGVARFSNITGLTANTQYFYRVRAYLGTTLNSGYSNVDDARTLPLPPAAPTLVSPAAGSTTENLTPRLDWNNSPGDNITYGVQVSTASTFAAGTLRVDMSDLPTSDYIVRAGDGLTWNTTYYWRANATNIFNSTSKWSASRTFKTAWGHPRPTNLIATDNSSTRIDLAWSDNSTGETGFKIERKKLGGAWAQVATVGTDNHTYSNTTGLTANTQYFYRVRAYLGTTLNSAYSDNASATTAPLAPTLVTPAINAINQSVTPVLDWSEPAGASTYGVQVSTAPTFTDIKVNETGLSTSTYTVPGVTLTADTPYFWRVNAANGSGSTSAWSAMRSFRTGP